MQTPLVWYDSLEVQLAEGGAWLGYGAALGRAIGNGDPEFRRGAHTVIDLRSGDFGFDDNSVSIQRGDTLRWLRLEAASGSRGLVDPLDQMGRHLWGASTGWRRGRHSITADYAQRAESARLFSEEEQASKGESGSIAWRYDAGAWGLGVTARRGHDRLEGLGVLLPSVRAAQRTRLEAVATLARERSLWAFRGAWSSERVSRFSPEDFLAAPDFVARSQTAWAALGYERSVGEEGRLGFDLGAGRHGYLDRFDAAPAAFYRFRAGPFAARLAAERVLAPVWTDLAAGEEPFLQSTWAGAIEVASGARGARHVAASFLVGRTRDRALVARLPLEELWLRAGIARDPVDYDFALLQAEAEGALGRLLLGGSGFVLGRGASSAEALVDPPVGFRGWAGWRGALFHGDLGVFLRAEVEAVGPRESPAGVSELCGDPEDYPVRTLDGYATLGATAAFTLLRATVTIRARNLEDVRREEPWIDCSTGSEALGPGRELRFALTMRLAN